MRTTDENDLREFRRKYATETDWAHRRWIGRVISFVFGAAAMALLRYLV